MKLSFLISILLILLLSQGCHVDLSTGDTSDPIPGSSLQTKGLNCYPVKMTIDGKSSTDNTFTFGNKIEFSFNNVTGLKRIKGNAYPGMSLRITNDQDSTIYLDEDLLESKGAIDLTPLKLEAYFKASLPYLNNEKYNIEIKIWDKKGSGKLTFNLPFDMKASDVLSIESNELQYSNIYFWDETDKKVVLDNNIDINHEFILINEGLEGFDVVDGMAFPGISLFIVDNNGKEIISNENLVSNVSESGIDPIELRDNQAPVTMTFTPGKTANPCHMKAKIFDLKNPDKLITIEAVLVLE